MGIRRARVVFRESLARAAKDRSPEFTEGAMWMWNRVEKEAVGISTPWLRSAVRQALSWIKFKIF